VIFFSALLMESLTTNLKIAKTLDISVPIKLLGRADMVID
jgi:hypothetical protein